MLIKLTHFFCNKAIVMTLSWYTCMYFRDNFRSGFLMYNCSQNCCLCNFLQVVLHICWLFCQNDNYLFNFFAQSNFCTLICSHYLSLCQFAVVQRSGHGNLGATCTGLGFLAISERGRVAFNISVPVTGLYDVVLRYEVSAKI